MIRDPMAEPCGLWRSPGRGVKPLGSQPSVLFQVGVKLKGWFTQEQDVYFSAIIHTYLKNLTSTSWKCGCQDNSSTWQTRKCHPSNPTQHGMVASANGRPRLVLTGFHTTAMFLLHLLVPWQLVCEDSFDNGTLIEGLISNTCAFSMGVLALSFNVEWFFWQPLWLKPERCQQSIKIMQQKAEAATMTVLVMDIYGKTWAGVQNIAVSFQSSECLCATFESTLRTETRCVSSVSGIQRRVHGLHCSRLL